MVWSPKPRPQWVAELNVFGRQLGSPAALVSLDEESLLDARATATGLDDFGDERAGAIAMRLFVRALDEEADLNLLGRIMARNEIVRALVNRLEVHDTLARHPEIRDERVDVASARRRHRSIGHVDPARVARAGSRAPRRADVGAAASVPAARTGHLRDRPAHRGGRPGVHVLASGRRPSTARCTRTAATFRTRIR